MIRKEVFKSRAEWLEYRNGQFMVGGSNIGTILGLNPYETPLAYWLRVKSGEEEMPKSSLYRGQFMEDGIARWFEQETGLKVVKKSGEISVFHNDKYPEYIQVAPDREIFSKDTGISGPRPILEIKDTRLIVDFDDDSTVPDEWFAQVQLQMAVMERPAAYLAINDGSKQMKTRLIHYDADFAAEIIRQACEWVERHIIGGEQPAPINGKDVQLIAPVSVPGVKKVGYEARSLYEKALVYKRAADEANAKFEALKCQIAALFDDRDTLELDGVPIATYKTFSAKRFDAERFAKDHPELYGEYLGKTTYRKLNILKKRKNEQ